MMEINDFEVWANAVRVLLKEFESQDLGYPSGVNHLREKASSFHRVPRDLQQLYSVCDGISLPDIHNGYFIESAERIASSSERGEPTEIQGKTKTAIYVFGSDGGGGRFALGTKDHAIYYLPSSGAVKNGVFIEDTVTTARTLATNLIAFLWLLKSDIEAFVHGDEHHSYIGS